MTDLKFKVSAKKHLFIIISSILIVLGLAVGTICHFIGGGFFNYGGQYGDYKTIEVTYRTSDDFSGEKVKGIADERLSGYLSVSYNDTALGGSYSYKFPAVVENEVLTNKANEITAALSTAGIVSGLAEAHTFSSTVGGSTTLIFVAIAAATAAVFQALYFAVRYKLSAAISVLLAHIHNIGVFVALVALTRIPVGIELTAIAAAVVLVTAITSCVLFDRIRKNGKEDELKDKPDAIVDLSAHECYAKNSLFLAVLACVAIVLFVALSIVAKTPFWACIAFFAGLIACDYGVSMFVPAVHSVFASLLDGKKLIKPKKNDKAKN